MSSHEDLTLSDSGHLNDQEHKPIAAAGYSSQELLTSMMYRKSL